MAILLHDVTDREVDLRGDTVIGRAREASLRIDNPRASEQHASLRWSGEGWELRDLGSSNGSFINGKRLEPGLAQALHEGDRLAFGDKDDPWLLVDDSPPPPMAVPEQGGEAVMGESGRLQLPAGPDPVVVFEQRGDEGWVACAGPLEIPVPDKLSILLHGESWSLDLARTVRRRTLVEPDDEPAWLLADCALHFACSSGDEIIQLGLGLGDERRPVPSRTYHRLLLLLARERLSDREQGLAESECGWIHIDDMAKQLDTYRSKVTADIYNLRKQFEQLPVEASKDLVEVRGRLRRIGSANLHIEAL